jgi:hypothetical protein
MSVMAKSTINVPRSSTHGHNQFGLIPTDHRRMLVNALRGTTSPTNQPTLGVCTDPASEASATVGQSNLAHSTTRAIRLGMVSEKPLFESQSFDSG